jgi:hypothetical protein
MFPDVGLTMPIFTQWKSVRRMHWFTPISRVYIEILKHL